MFHHCCFALPARINFTFKIVIVPSTTLPMTNNLSLQGVLGGTLKSVDCQRFFCRFCGFLSSWPDEGLQELPRAIG